MTEMDRNIAQKSQLDDHQTSEKGRFKTLSRKAKIAILTGISLLLLSLIALFSPRFGGPSLLDFFKQTPYTVEVQSAELVILAYPKAESDKEFVVLNISIHNTFNKDLDYNVNNFILKDEKGQSYQPEGLIHDPNHKFSEIELVTGTLSADERESGYLVYQLDKDAMNFTLDTKLFDLEKYESYSSSLKISNLKIEDHSQTVLPPAQEYIRAVFLGGEFESEDQNIKQSFQLTRENFYRRLRTELLDHFFSYRPSDAELDAFIVQYTAANAKRAQIEYKVRSYFPTSATVTISSRVINLYELSILDQVAKYLEEKTGSSVTSDRALLAEAEKSVFENLHKNLDSLPLTTLTNEDTLSLYPSGKTWMVDFAGLIGDPWYRQLEKSMAGDYFN